MGAQDLTGGDIDDADVEVFDETDDADSRMVAADADLEHVALMAQRDLSADIDPVMTDTPVRLGTPGR